jgi:hypothetical protein
MMQYRLSMALLICTILANAANVCRVLPPVPHMSNRFPDDGIDGHASVGGNPISRYFRLTAKAGAPELRITVRGFPFPNGATDSVRTGEIKIAGCEDGQRLQILPIMTSQEIGSQNLRAFDINFDGYLDLSMLVEVGSTYGSQAWWLYDPASRRFVRNHLTRQLAGLRSNEYRVNHKKHEIAVSNIRASYPSLTTRYHVEANQLVMLHEETFVQGTPCIVTFLDLVNGRMKVTAVRRYIDNNLVK